MQSFSAKLPQHRTVSGPFSSRPLWALMKMSNLWSWQVSRAINLWSSRVGLCVDAACCVWWKMWVDLNDCLERPSVTAHTTHEEFIVHRFIVRVGECGRAVECWAEEQRRKFINSFFFCCWCATISLLLVVSVVVLLPLRIPSILCSSLCWPRWLWQVIREFLCSFPFKCHRHFIFDILS